MYALRDALMENGIVLVDLRRSQGDPHVVYEQPADAETDADSAHLQQVVTIALVFATHAGTVDRLATATAIGPRPERWPARLYVNRRVIDEYRRDAISKQAYAREVASTYRGRSIDATYGADWFSVVVVLAAAAFYVYDYLFVDDEPEEGRSNTPERLWGDRPDFAGRVRAPGRTGGRRSNRSRRSRDQSGVSVRRPPAHSLPSLSHSTSCTAPTATGSKRSTISARQRPTRSKSTSNDERPLHPLLDRRTDRRRPGPDRAGRRRAPPQPRGGHARRDGRETAAGWFEPDGVTDGTATFRLRVGTTRPESRPTLRRCTPHCALFASTLTTRRSMTPRSSTTALCRPTRSGKPDTGDANRENTGDIDSDTETDIDSGTAETVDSEPDEEPEPETDDRKFGIDRAGDAGDDGRQGLASAMRGTDEHRRAMSGERVRVWRVVPTIVHPDADVDVSTIEPETGLTQRAARECAAERNRRRDPRRYCPVGRQTNRPRR